mgnify:CR=1 FL=1|tara:strand:+ start:1556 stop:1693 length:138 start_codon:yes stop_codon:yes gene_type:complete
MDLFFEVFTMYNEIGLYNDNSSKKKEESNEKKKSKKNIEMISPIN